MGKTRRKSSRRFLPSYFILLCSTYRLSKGTSVLETVATIPVYEANTQVQQSLSNIATEISHLNKLTNTIRRAGNDTQNLRANNFRMLDDEGNDVEPTLLANFEYYIANRFRGCSETIQKRLASAMLLRRKRVLYRRQRQGAAAIKPLETVAQAPVTLPSAQMALDKKRSGRRNIGAEGTVVQSQVMSATTLVPAKFKMAALNPSVISASKTVALGSHESLAFPIAPGYAIKQKYNATKKSLLEDYRHAVELGKPKLEANAALNESLRAVLQDIGEIPCPYCFYALPAEEVLNEQSWHRHVKNDLDPYICLFEDCPHPDTLYSHSEEWRDHLQEHAKVWRCLSHPELGAFSTGDEFIQHIRAVHNSNLSDAQLRILANRNGRKKQNLFSSCPLCGQDANEIDGDLEHHITGHLRSLALKSLPTYQEAIEDMEIDENSHTVSQPLSRSTLRDAEFSNESSYNAAKSDIVMEGTQDDYGDDGDDGDDEQAFDAFQKAESSSSSTSTGAVYTTADGETEEMDYTNSMAYRYIQNTLAKHRDSQSTSHKQAHQPSQPSQQPPNLPSSYWSVSESNGFPHLLRRFGSDWPGIATYLGTKTATMVKNYYMRGKDSDHPEWSTFVDIADGRKREAGLLASDSHIAPGEADNIANARLQISASANAASDIVSFDNMMTAITPEQAGRLNSMPPDKIKEALRRWQRMRQAQPDERFKLSNNPVSKIPGSLGGDESHEESIQEFHNRWLKAQVDPEPVSYSDSDKYYETNSDTDSEEHDDTMASNKRRVVEQASEQAEDDTTTSTSQPRGANASETLRMRDLANEESDAEEEGGKIKCPCNRPDDDGDIIYCETCDTWQHIECFYPDNQEEATREDFAHSCHDCKPRPLDRQRALRRRTKGKGKALEAQKSQKRQRKDSPSSEWQEIIVASKQSMAQSGGDTYRHWVRDQDLVAPLWEPSLGEVQTADSARRELSASEKRQAQQVIYQSMARYTSPPHPTSWQSTITVRERMSAIIDLIELGGARPSSTDELDKLVKRICEFELQSFTDASTKDDYRLALAREIMHMRANATS
ncbi:Putative Phd-finger domain-containing protein [[Torrubiella] hemipterigena]|uniref:Putative Phd-finger domain-containing protein n=1 Tax=[Torrubiella] hemipterigena TaxID=1531966 RepID=A0A0A1TEZ1_9HYPO|nr:Putative Phd-finger domain-containing protein [[Torrubiella] hemipterigena]